MSITSWMYSCEMNTSLLPLVLRKPRGAGNLRCYRVFIANCNNAEESQSTDFSRRVSSLAVLPVHLVSAVLCMEMVASCFLCLLCLHSRTASKRSSRKPRAPPMSPAVKGRLLSLGWYIIQDPSLAPASFTATTQTSAMLPTSPTPPLLRSSSNFCLSCPPTVTT